MSGTRDPYYEWLGIPPKDQPPHHYRLLGIELFEPNRDVIATAADRQMSFVKGYQCGEDSELSQRILNELAAARLCLLNPEKKRAYDDQLRSELARQNAAGAVPSDDVVSEPSLGTLELDDMASDGTAEPDLDGAVSLLATGTEERSRNIVPAPVEDGWITTVLLNPAYSRVIVVTAASVAACLLAGIVVGLVVLGALRGRDSQDPPLEGKTLAVSPVESNASTADLADVAEGPRGPGAVADSAVVQGVLPEEGSTAMPGGDEKRPAEETTTVAERDEAVGGKTLQDRDGGGAAMLRDAGPRAERSEPAGPAQAASEERAPERPLAETAPGPSDDLAKEPLAAVRNTVETPADLDAAAQKHKVPNEHAQQQIRKQLAEQYQLAPELPPSRKRQLARQFVALAREPIESPERRFVLLGLAGELACQGADAELMLEALGQLGEGYELNATALKAQMLLELLGPAEVPEAVMAFLKNYQDVVFEALRNNELDLAWRLSSAANQLTDRPIGTRAFREGIQQIHRDVDLLRAQYQQIVRAQAELERDPSNGQAHGTVGRWLCFVRGEWERGLPHLAAGDEGAFRAVALRELNQPPNDAAGQIELADAWWALAQRTPGEFQYAMLLRAQSWYSRVDPKGLAETDKLKLQERLMMIGRRSGQLSAVRQALLGAGDPDVSGEPRAGPAPPRGQENASQELQALFQRALTAALQTRDFEKASRLFGRCNDLCPKQVAIINNYAMASLRCGNPRRAIRLLEIAVELSPRCHEVACNLAQLMRLSRTGRLTLDSTTRRLLEKVCSMAEVGPNSAGAFGFRYMPLAPIAGAQNTRTSPTSPYEEAEASSYRPGASSDIGAYNFYDRACLACNGRGYMKCPHCSGGKVSHTRVEASARNPVTGGIIAKTTHTRIRCSHCGGTGKARCPACGGSGIGR